MNRKQISWKVGLACSLSMLLLFGRLAQCLGAETNTIDCAKEREKAVKGDAEAQYQTAFCCHFETNYTEMANWYRKAADQGHAQAAYNLGYCYARGKGVAKESENAFHWFRKAAELGGPEKQYWVSGVFLYGGGFFDRGILPADPQEGLKWLRKSAERGWAFAQRELAEIFEKGEFVPKDDAEAFNWYCRAAAQGDSLAEMRWISLYSEHWKNPAQLAKWLLANPTSPRCQSALGELYALGHGVPKNEVKAVQWYRKAAEQGDDRAQHFLGKMYEEGKGTAKNPAEAAKWYRKAADHGYRSSQFALAELYAEGRGVPRDGLEAIKWYQKAAEKGNTLALVSIANIWAFGKGVPKNGSEAIKWYTKALDKQDGWLILPKDLRSEVEFNLGVFYFNGDGVPVDYVEAYKWFNLAAAGGYKDAPEIRDALARKMTPEQLAEGQREARDFAAKKGGGRPAWMAEKGTGNDANATSPKSSGTGFFITEDGYLLTNAHVVEEAARIEVRTHNRAFVATLVKLDRVNDVAVLKAAATSSCLPLAASRAVRLGDSVFTIGFPNPRLQGVEPKLTDGKVSSVTGAQDDARHFQISVAVQPGNSGGALVNSVGNVVGIVTARLSDMAALKSSGALPQNVNYAIKSSYVLSLLESLPEVAGKLKEPSPAKERKFEDVIKEAQEATALVLVY